MSNLYYDLTQGYEQIVQFIHTQTAPLIVFDPHGTLWGATTGWRMAHPEHHCLRFSPGFGNNTLSLNPLELTDKTENGLRASIQPLTTLLLPEESRSAGVTLLAAFIHIFNISNQPCNLPRVAQVLRAYSSPLPWLKHQCDQLPEGHALLASLNAIPRKKFEKVARSLAQKLAIFVDPAVALSLSHGTFSLTQLRLNKTALYLCPLMSDMLDGDMLALYRLVIVMLQPQLTATLLLPEQLAENYKHV